MKLYPFSPVLSVLITALGFFVLAEGQSLLLPDSIIVEKKEIEEAKVLIRANVDTIDALNKEIESKKHDLPNITPVVSPSTYRQAVNDAAAKPVKHIISKHTIIKEKPTIINNIVDTVIMYVDSCRLREAMNKPALSTPEQVKRKGIFRRIFKKRNR